MFVHTAHGPGRVVDEQSVRGRKSFLVEGSGFKVWLDERDLRVANEVNDDNSTTLPYDPTPQHPTDMFSDESTIQPTHEIDPDETLSASDSLSFDDAEEYPYPGPSADNFAREAGFFDRREGPSWNPEMVEEWVRKHNPSYKGSDDEDEVRIMRDSMIHVAEGRHHEDLMYGEHALPGISSPPEGYRGKHRNPFPMPIFGFGDSSAGPDDPAHNEVWDAEDLEHADNLGYGPNAHTWNDRMEEKFGDAWNVDRPMPPSLEEYMQQQNGGLVNKIKRMFSGSQHEEEWGENQDEDDDISIKHFSNYHYAGGLTDMADSAVEDLVEDPAPKPKKKPQQQPRLSDEDDDSTGVAQKAVDAAIPADVASHINDDTWRPFYWPGRASSLYERPAGLSDKYIRIAAPVDHYSDPVQQFRDDPVGFIQKRGYTMSDSLDIRLAEYVDLVEHDSSIRTAAWRDVRTKALRLRREGRVHVKDISPTQIYANVEGDSDTYETMIVKGANNSQSITDWHCSCPWGRWAFKRQMSYVGRLCSHGYASYLEMESQQMKANNKRRKSAGSSYFEHQDPKWLKKNPLYRRNDEDEYGRPLKDDADLEEGYYMPKRRKKAGIVEDFKQWADNENDGMIDQNAIDNFIYLLNSQHDGDHTVVSEDDAEKLYDALDGMKSTGMVRDYDVDYLERPGDVYKDASLHEADVLALRPQSLTPDFYFVEDGQGGESWTDVTKDDRKTTGPDNMVRKSRRLTGRELHYASDEELGEAVKDWAGTGSKLEKLRSLSGEGPDLQNMRDRNDEIRDVIDELHDRGIDAAQFVASLRFAADTADDAADDDSKKKPASQQGQPDMSGKPSQTGQPGGSSSITKPETNTSTPAAGASSSGTSAGGNNTPAAGKTNDLSNPTKDPDGVGFGGGPATMNNQRREDGYTSGGGGAGIDPNMVMNGLGQAASGFVQAIPSMMQALPGAMSGLGQLGSGIGSGLGGLASGLSGILRSSNQHTATPVGGFPNVQLTNQESFQGSGPNPKYWMGSSECYVDDHERERFVDVTDLDDDPIIKYTGDKPKQGPKKASRSRRPFVGSENANPQGATLTSGGEIDESGVSNLDQVFKAGASGKPWDGHRVRDFRRYVKQNGGRPTHQMLQDYLNKPHRGLDQGGTQHLQDYTSYVEQHDDEFSPRQGSNDSSDIVAQFHRMGGIEAINNSGGGGTYSDSSIADRAQGFLRTAGRVYSLAEQRELEEESHPSGARNLKDLDLRNTHYEDM